MLLPEETSQVRRAPSLQRGWFALDDVQRWPTTTAIHASRAEGKTLQARIGLSREGLVTILTVLANAPAVGAPAVRPVCRTASEALNKIEASAF